MKGLIDRVRAFLRGSTGSVTVEYVLWMPVMAGLMAMATDATVLMTSQTSLFTAARDASRSVALGRKTAADAQSELLARLGTARKYTATVSVSGGFVTTDIRVPFNDVLVFGGRFAGGTLAGKAVMYVESGS